MLDIMVIEEMQFLKKFMSHMNQGCLSQLSRE